VDLEKIKAFIQKNPVIAYPVLGGFVFLIWACLMFVFSPSGKAAPSLKGAKDSSIGVSVGGLDQQAYVARLEKNYYDFEDRVKSVEAEIKNLTVQNKAMAKTILKLDNKLVKKMDQRLNEDSQESLMPAVSMELAVADVKPLNKEGEGFVYLPIGSFCQGTLLTGVYAAADVNNPLPVLISLDDAFYGPNKTRIPLKGAFVLGKAYGDIVSQRALIQIVAVSSVLPDGHAFEREENLGYVTDEFGELGIHGQLIRNTGKELALSFMGGFMSGGAQALAEDEVTSTSNPYGGVSKQVTGSVGKNAVFAGLAKSAGRMSEYYEHQTENLIPAVHIRSGAKVYFIVQKGVSIDGLPRVDFSRISGIN
jgi:hypothetical protein